ncbi:MAG: hypothetical protein DRP96_04020 [Candidatus Neomarinimicrobiota bacterium]|nr:MAG: hypothetical protein DRP96_04020 [Candidatus Neomarinimicrobiota bacterium]
MKRFYLLVVIVLLFAGLLPGENLLVNPGFEEVEPAFWSPLNGTLGTDVIWEMTEVASGIGSFKVTKSSATSDVVGWVSVNNANLYWNNAGSGTYALSGYMKTVGVNTNPANDDARIGIVYEFKDESGNELATEYVWVDQSAADVDWAEYTGAAILSAEPASVVMKLIMGKDATGTVYFDNIGCNTADSWTMGPFNSGAETIKGWLNWYASDNGSYGIHTDAQAYTGSYSAELYKPDTTSSTSEIVYYSIPVAVEAGAWYKIGVWVKTAGVNDSAAFEPTYITKERLDDRLGLCYFFHTGNIDEEWSLSGGDKYVYVDQTTPDKEWTHYVVAEQAPDDATGISVRARFTSRPTGTAWFDDFSVQKMVVSGGTAISPELVNAVPEKFELLSNYPNPFNPETNIRFSVPEISRVNISIYNMLGQKVRTLVDNVMIPGYHTVTWDACNDMGDPVATGVYIYVMTSKDQRFTNKMMLIR